ncbi:MAG TPA: nuclear transport factor 2 family protein [Pyrinomonadaceae bacterium]|jgi:hypothetical protein
MIKALTIIMVMLVALAAIARCQKAETQTNTALIDLEKQSWVAWQKRDGSFYQNFLSDDHVEIGGNGTASKKEVVGFVGSPVCVVTSYALDSFNVTILNPDTALIVYHAVQDTKCGGKQVPSPAWVSSLYVRRTGKWLNVMYQQTPTPVK